MKKDDCIFCKLANGDIPTNAIFENELFKVFLDMSPATKGHCLIVPKDHAENLFELPDETAAEAIKLAKKIGHSLKAKLNADGVNLVQNNGEVAGQTVMHFHMHVIPRYENDGQKIGWKPNSPSAEELSTLCQELKA